VCGSEVRVRVSEVRVVGEGEVEWALGLAPSQGECANYARRRCA
jgi:hypothetical protein